MLYASDMTEDTRMSAIKGTYRPLKVLDHEFLGRVHILQHYATTQLLVMKERTANNKEHFREEEALIEKRAALRHPNVMILKDWSMKKESKLCAEFYILRTFMQYYIENAELIARKKIKDQTVFDDIEIVQLLYDGIDGLSYLQSQGYSHGFLRPELLMRDEKRNFIICDRLLEGTAMDAQRYARTAGFDLYCSPEVWNNLCNNKSHPTNGYLDDAFAFGLVLLRVANLQSPKEIYLPSGLIDQNRLNTLIEKAASRYDHVILFRQVLEKLLNIDPKSRTDATAIRAGLPNRQQIQMFFNSETEDLYFDGPKSQMHNTMLGRESVLPIPQKNQSIMLGRSTAGDRSNYLAGLNNSITSKPYASQKEPIFNQNNGYQPQQQTQPVVNQNSNPGNQQFSQYSAPPQQFNRAPVQAGPAAVSYPNTQGLMNTSQQGGSGFTSSQLYPVQQQGAQPVARGFYQQPNTSAGATQGILSGGQPFYGSNPSSQYGQPAVAAPQYGSGVQNQAYAQASPAIGAPAGGARGYTGGNPFLAGPVSGTVASPNPNYAVGNYGQQQGSSFQASGQSNLGGRPGPTSVLEGQGYTQGGQTTTLPLKGDAGVAVRTTPGLRNSGSGRAQSYTNNDPSMTTQPKTGNKFAPL